MEKITDQDLNKNLLINMCRVQNIVNDKWEKGKRIFDVLLSDVFHMLETLRWKNSKKYFEEVVYITQNRNTTIPVIQWQTREIREYIWKMITKFGKKFISKEK